MLCLPAWTWLPGQGKEPGQHRKDHTETKLPHSLFYQCEDPLNRCFPLQGNAALASLSGWKSRQWLMK